MQDLQSKLVRWRWQSWNQQSFRQTQRGTRTACAAAPCPSEGQFMSIPTAKRPSAWEAASPRGTQPCAGTNHLARAQPTPVSPWSPWVTYRSDHAWIRASWALEHLHAAVCTTFWFSGCWDFSAPVLLLRLSSCKVFPQCLALLFMGLIE